MEEKMSDKAAMSAVDAKTEGRQSAQEIPTVARAAPSLGMTERDGVEEAPPDCHCAAGTQTGRGNLDDGSTRSVIPRSAEGTTWESQSRQSVQKIATAAQPPRTDTGKENGWFDSMRRQESEMRAIVPGFDLARELRDAAFARMVTGGMDVKSAYIARTAALARAASQRAEEAGRRGAEALGAARPKENGGGAPVTPAVFDPRKLSRGQREDIRRAVRDAAARGEKYYLPY